jgi:hypothetical protein
MDRGAISAFCERTRIAKKKDGKSKKGLLSINLVNINASLGKICSTTPHRRFWQMSYGGAARHKRIS